MNTDYNEFKNRVKIISSTGTHIDNLKEIIEYLNSIESLNEDLIARLDYIIAELAKYDLDNKTELIMAIEHKKNASKENEFGDKKALDQLVIINPDFKNLNVINTSREYNDSKLNIEYITFKKQNGEVEMLQVKFKNKLQQYIDENVDRLSTLTAEEVFKYLKENINKNVKFYNAEEMTETPEIFDKAIIKDEEVIREEKREVNEYMKEHNIDSEMMVAVDDYGERIYRVEDFVCKFSFVSGERRMKVIRETDKQLVNEDAEEPEEVVDEINIEETDIKQTFDNDVELDTFEEKKAPKDVKYEDLPLLETNVDNYNYVKGLLNQQELNSYILTKEEILFVQSYMKSIIVAMGNEELSETLSQDELQLLEYYISTINTVKVVELNEIINNENTNAENEVKPNQLDSNVENKNLNLDEQIIENYYENKQALDMTREKQKQIVLLNPQETKQAGVANTIIVMELSIIAMYILGFIYYFK